MFPLKDITLYYDGLKIPSLPNDSDFSNKKNYICDFYHQMLNGYKPPKTGRICITIDEKNKWDNPWYFGAICNTSNVIDATKYLSLDKVDKYKYLLDIVHQSCLTLATFYNWSIDIFEAAYKKVSEMNFEFSLMYPAKKAKDKKTVGQVLIEKTENTTTLYLLITSNEKTKRIKLFENKNWFWFDIAYEMGKNSKWLDKNSFGVYSEKTDKYGYYSRLDDVIIGKLDIRPDEFVL